MPRARGAGSPQHDLAAIAVPTRVGADHRVAAHQQVPRSGHPRMAALVAAADQHRAAAPRAAGVDCGVAGSATRSPSTLTVAAGGAGHAGASSVAPRVAFSTICAVGAAHRAVGIDDAALVDQRAIDADCRRGPPPGPG